MNSLNSRLSALHAERGHLVANFEATLQPSLTEERELDQTESDALDLARERIEGIDRQIERLSQAETLLARRSTAIVPSYPGDRPGSAVVLRSDRQRPHIEMQRRNDYKGASFTRMAIAICVAGRWNAAAYARQRWGDDELADCIQYATWDMQIRAPVDPMGGTGPGGAEAVGGAGGGASLVRLEHMGEEFIELLRPMLIVARLPNMRRLQFDGAGTLLIPRQTGGVAGGYVGEGGTIRVQRLNFGQLQLTPSKLAVIVPTTNELLHRADPGIEQLIRDDMLQGTARTIDTHFFSIQPPGAGPAGVLIGRGPFDGGYIPPFDDTAQPPSPSVTQVSTALRNMIYELRRFNVPMLAPVWIFNARTKEFLRLQRTSQEIFAWKAEIDAGTLLGYPIINSTNVPIGTWTGGTPAPGAETTAYALIDASQLIWAEDMLPFIDASEHASIVADDDPTPPPVPPAQLGYGYAPGRHQAVASPAAPDPGFYSAFQNDMVFMRIRMRHTWNRRHDVAVVYAHSEV